MSFYLFFLFECLVNVIGYGFCCKRSFVGKDGVVSRFLEMMSTVFVDMIFIDVFVWKFLFFEFLVKI